MPQLQVRQKWRHTAIPLKVNDIVLVSEDNVPRRAWPMGRVVELCSSKDGLICTVKIKTTKEEMVKQKIKQLNRRNQTIDDT